MVEREVLRYRRGAYGAPFRFLDFSNGKGYAITNEEDFSRKDEDGPMIGAQYRYMHGQPLEELKPVMLATDSASMRARRVLAQLIKAQQVSTETEPQKTGT